MPKLPMPNYNNCQKAAISEAEIAMGFTTLPCNERSNRISTAISHFYQCDVGASNGGSSGGGSSGGTSPSDPVPPTNYNPSPNTGAMALLLKFLQDNPFGLIPCEYVNQFTELGNYQAPISVRKRLFDIAQKNKEWQPPQFKIQTLAEAQSTIVNCDYYSIHITKLPEDGFGNTLTPSQFINQVRKDIDYFISPEIGVSFMPYVGNGINDTELWYSNNPLGAIVHIEMSDNGSVLTTKYSDLSWTFSTITTPLDLVHPVSGNRMFGIQEDKINVGYNFYILGVDRVSNKFFDFGAALGYATGFSSVKSVYDGGDKLWTNVQRNIIRYINDPRYKGIALYYQSGPRIIARPDWNDVKLLMTGAMTIEEYKNKHCK